MYRQSKSFILSINCGSSSLKFKLFSSRSLKTELEGHVDNIGNPEGNFQITDQAGNFLINSSAHFQSVEFAINELIAWLKHNNKKYPLAAIGHRLIQGGPEHKAPEIITPELLDILKQQIYLAPNHLPDEINAIHAFKIAFKKIVQVACYDTLFHRNMPAFTKYYPLPAEYIDKGLIKYGFHGLSYEYVMKKLGSKISATKRRKIIIAHLGNGASMVAVKNGIGIETTMGISPIGGLVMGTRSGDLDPGVLLFLLKEGHLTPDELDELLSKHSGLKAIGGTNDVQELLINEAKDPKAKLALSVFCYTAKKYIGALAAAMGGLDMLIFTGGIGENSAIVRDRICEDMDFLGITIHQRSNQISREIISPLSSKVQVRVMPTNEEWMIAHHTQNFIDNI
jgi:acetate kinase